MIWVLLGTLLLAEDSQFTVGHFTFTSDKSWVKAPSSPMVKAALNHAKKDGPLLKFFHFGKGQGGGVHANLQRWKSQFQGATKVTSEEKTYGEQTLTIVSISGTYMVGPLMSPNKVATPGYMLLGAIIPHPSGDVFLKMTAPEAELKDVKADFEKLIATAFAGTE